MALYQRHRPVGKFPYPQFRPLKIGKNTDRTSAFFLHGADTTDQRAHHLMSGMAHVDAKQIGACFVQFLDHRFIGRGRPERRENFHIT